ncbi:MAG TPA: trifunctional glycosyltransferase/class I SAM-dependent methyltransferase/polysaccharide deacetylase [Terriglobia bacterium]|nr:trifunctional glycosyltransferase/class I SAM-dependent methyltransferase/polysaccharide deacetylase [Terriglobia bacterium]
MNQPTVSVIIPAFNAAETLRTALGSVRGQSFRRWEAVVIDDGSKDCTAEIVASLAHADGRIRYHKSPSNRGPSAARNAGLAKAQGEYVMFLDADDWIGKNHISRLVHALRSNPLAGGAYTGYTFVTEDGRSEYRICPKLSEPLSQYLAHSCLFAIHSCLVKRHLVQEARGFDESLVFGEDWDLWQRLTRQNVEFLSIDACSAYYQARRDSLTRACGRIIPDGLKVIRRGHAPDCNAAGHQPDPQLGTPVVSLNSAMFYFLIAATGFLVGAGADVPQGCDDLPKIDAQESPEDITVSTLLEGLSQGAGCSRAELAARWTELCPSLARALRTVFSDAVVGLNEDGILQAVERQLVNELGPQSAPVTIGRTRVLRTRLEDAGTQIEIPDGIEVVRAYVSLNDRVLDVVELPAVSGTLPQAAVVGAALRNHRSIFEPETRRIIRNNRRLMRQLVGRRTLHFLWDLLHVPTSRWRHRVGAYLSTRINSYLAAQFGLVPAQSSPQGKPTLEDLAPRVAEPDPEQKTWEKVFATPDPWSYGSDYEQRKYEHTLELLPHVPIGSALELACAEGHFTAQLGPRVGHLIAADISQRALSRAQQRCRNLQNITFRQMNLRRDPFGRFDLIVCSEVLYYLDDRHELRRLAARLAQSLNPGGHLLMAHANLVVDDQCATGFDWMHGFGAKFIGETFAAVPGLRMVRELRTSLYRVQLFRREANLHSHPTASREVVIREAVPPSDPESYGQICCGGCAVTPACAYSTSVTRELPILMYHRIASHGREELARYRVSPENFERQLAYLKQHGYASIGLDGWAYALSALDGRLPGRLVCLTFDDGYRDFRERAWPLLKHYGFSATVFLPTDFVGGYAEWDRSFGDPAELMAWDDIRALAKEGVRFGAHGAGHRRLDQLSAADMLAEARLSNEKIAAELGSPASVIAYPYGAHSALVRRAMEACGFGCAVTTDPGLSRLGDHLYGLPRQEISGSDKIEDFVAKLGPPQPATVNRRIRYYLDRRRRRNLWA